MAATEDIVNFAGRHGPGIGITWVFSERAIAATIAAKICYGQKDFARVGNSAAFEPIAKRSCSIEERSEVLAVALNQGVCLCSMHGINSVPLLCLTRRALALHVFVG